MSVVSEEKRKVYENWYVENKCIYEACGDTIKRLIEVLLKQNEVPYHSINFRVKEKDSFLKKCFNNKYDDPTSQITDVCGVRIISYTNHDVKTICEIIERDFKVDVTNSIDKSKQMNEDQVGYLSIHYIVSLKDERASLPEYSRYKNIKFEIQVRTLLQHAWAEIEHDRNYKFSGELPSEIKRRFYLVAGTLELLDREFEQLSFDIDEYAATIRTNTQKGNLEALVNTTSLTEYLSIKLKGYAKDDGTFNRYDKEIIAELQDFGIETLEDLDNIINERIFKLDYWNEHPNYIGSLRVLMMTHDPDKYFEKAWKNHWNYMDRNEFKELCEMNNEILKHRDKIKVD